MSADLLRRAASLMRERAEGAAGFKPYLSQWAEQADALHIASWHPAVALAVADWLDCYAAVLELAHPIAFDTQALAVARAYLGEVDA